MSKTDYKKRVAIPSPESINGGLTYCRPSTMLAIFGSPRAQLTSECMPPTNAKLKKSLGLYDVGPFRVYGLKAMAEKLTRLFAKVKKEKPELYAMLGTAGVTCCRLVRGTDNIPSNHAFGGAIDLTIGGDLDAVGDGKCQKGLLDLYPYFHNEGFYWGCEFRGPREDSMHFELADETVRKLHAQKKLVV